MGPRAQQEVGSERYPLVFSPLTIGNVELKNRIVRTAHGTNFSVGGVNDRLIAYHEARAAGGVALSILEVAAVHPSSRGALVAYDDKVIESYQTLIRRIHRHGMRMFQQLWHGGSMAPTSDGSPSWSPSSVPSPDGNMPVTMTQDMIAELIEAFAQAARRCQLGGLDGVEIHAAHGYLLGQFLSPLTNRRTDRYGGDAEGRMRLLIDALAAVRQAVGAGFPVGVRLSGSEAVAGGLEAEDTSAIAQRLADDGLIDYLNLSLGSFYSTPLMIGAMHEPHGYQLPIDEQVAGRLAIPRIAAGRILNLEEAESVLASGTADLVSMVRATIADPELVHKSALGRHLEVRPCIGCNDGCVGGVLGARRRLGCTVNPDVGRESRVVDLVPVTAPKRVLVIGGGPAGLEAARVAALRGHEVIVHERLATFGGMTAVARRAPGREEFGRFCDWQVGELERLGVTLCTSSPISLTSPAIAAADVLVVAVGAVPRTDGFLFRRPGERITGLEPNRVRSVVDVLNGDVANGPVVVYDELGGYSAVGAAEYLVHRGLEVCYATSQDQLGFELGLSYQREPAQERLALAPNFSVRTAVWLDQVADDHIVLAERYTGRTERIEAEAVVLVTGYVPRTELATALRRAGRVLLPVGDCRSPHDLERAVQDGRSVGISV